MSSVADSPSIEHKSLRSIPGDQKNLISSILDLNNSWIDLAKEMGFEEKAIAVSYLVVCQSHVTLISHLFPGTKKQSFISKEFPIRSVNIFMVNIWSQHN